MTLFGMSSHHALFPGWMQIKRLCFRPLFIFAGFALLCWAFLVLSFSGFFFFFCLFCFCFLFFVWWMKMKDLSDDGWMGYGYEYGRRAMVMAVF